MEELSRSFRLQRSSSCLGRILGRSQSSRLVMESVSSECAAIAGYQRLTQSMRFAGEHAAMRKQQRSRGWRFLSRAFSRKEVEDEKIGEIEERKGKEKEKEKKKRRSSWLPDPDKRWPVQGW